MQRDSCFVEITAPGGKVLIKALKSYLALLRKYLTIIQQYNDKKTINKVETMQRTLLALLTEARNGNSNHKLRTSTWLYSTCPLKFANENNYDHTLAIPKVLRDALKKLAMPQDMWEIKHLVTTALEHLNTDENSQVVELPEGPPMELV